MTTVRLTQQQCVYVRQLLFEELHEAAEILAGQAAGATQGNIERENPDGEDALATWQNRLRVTAELLDTVGWSVATDTATIVKLERRRREA